MTLCTAHLIVKWTSTKSGNGTRLLLPQQLHSQVPLLCRSGSPTRLCSIFTGDAAAAWLVVSRQLHWWSRNSMVVPRHIHWWTQQPQSRCLCSDSLICLSIDGNTHSIYHQYTVYIFTTQRKAVVSKIEGSNFESLPLSESFLSFVKKLS